MSQCGVARLPAGASCSAAVPCLQRRPEPRETRAAAINPCLPQASCIRPPSRCALPARPPARLPARHESGMDLGGTRFAFDPKRIDQVRRGAGCLGLVTLGEGAGTRGTRLLLLLLSPCDCHPRPPITNRIQPQPTNQPPHPPRASSSWAPLTASWSMRTLSSRRPRRTQTTQRRACRCAPLGIRGFVQGCGCVLEFLGE